MDYRVLVVAVAFVLILVWRMRPALSEEEAEPAVRGLEAAKDDAARITILIEAGEGYARALGGGRKAAACFSRALRLAPSSLEVATRATAALARSPRDLEALAWRRLGAEPLSPEHRAVAYHLLGELARIYEKKARTRPKARALEHVLEALPKPTPSPDEPA